MTWRFVHRVWALDWCPRKLSLGAQTLCMALLLLIPTTTSPAHADCPAAPIGDSDDMAISFLAANGVQAGSASLLASTVKEGIVVYDDANDTLKLCDGDNWIAVGSGSGTDTLASLSCTAGQIAKFNGSVWACATDGGGSGGAPGNPVAFSVNKNGTNQTVTANTSQALTWSTEAFDTNDNFDTSTGRFTPTVPGKYLATVNVVCNDATAYCQAILRKNGAIVASNYGRTTTTNAAAMVTSIVDMNGTGDYLDAAVWNASGTTVGGAVTQTYFTGSLLGGGGGNGGDPVSYLIKGMSANQSGLASGTVISFTTQVSSAGTKITHSGNGITLAGGSRYMLRAFIRQGTAGSALDYRIFDVTNGANVPSAVASANSNSNFSDTDATAFVAPSASTTYEVRVAGGGGSALSGYSYFSAMELGGGNGGTDTLADLSCATNEIPKWNGSAWACATDGGGSGGDATSYLHASGPAKSNVAVGTVLPFDNTYGSVGADISLNTGNSRFTLKAGKTYRLMGQMVISATSPTGALWYRWYDVNGSAEIGSGGYSMTTDHTTTYSGMPLAVAYVTPSTDTDVELRISSASPATTMDVHISYAWIETIGGGGSDTLSGLSCATNEIPKWNGSAWVCATDGGGSGGSASNPVAFSVNKNGTDQAGVASAMDVAVTWPNKVFDTNTNFDTGTGRFTPTVAGEYILAAGAGWAAPSASKFWIVAIRKNGAKIAQSAGHTSNGGGFGAPVSVVTSANGSTDYFDVVVYQGSGSTQTISGSNANTYFTGALVGGGTDTLAGLICATNEIPKWNGSAWACAVDGGGASPLSGRTLATQCSYTWSANATGWRDRTWVAGDCTNGLPETGDIATGWARNGNGTAGMVTCNISTGSHYNHPTFGATSGTVICSYFREDAGGGGSSQWTDVSDGINYAGGKVGIGTATPSALLELQKDGGPAGLSLLSFGTAGSVNSSIVNVRGTAGTLASPGLLATDDRIGGFLGSTVLGASGTKNIVSMEYYADGAHTTTSAPTRITFSTTPTGADARAERMRITSSGNIGIGTPSPAAKLEVRDGHIAMTGASLGGSLIFVSEDQNGSYSNTADERRFQLMPTGMAGGDTSFGYKLSWRNADGSARRDAIMLHKDGHVYFPGGNVGIGTANPTQELHVYGADDTYVRVQTASATHAAGIQLSTPTNGNYGSILVHRSSDNALILLNSESGPVILGANETEMMRIADNGYVGIGLAAPGYRLDLPNTSGLGGRGRANQWTTYSDGRFKTNVETIDNALRKITALRGVSYISTTEPNAARQVGFIAQEVEKVVPEVVSVSTTSVTMPDGSTQVVDDYRSLAYDRLVPVLTEAIKELKADNDNLRAQLKAANDNDAAQDAVLEDLRVQIEALKASR